MIRIPVGHGKFAIIDDCDLDLMLAHSWCLTKSNQVHCGYRKKDFQLSLEIARRKGLNSKFDVDHINTDTLDNRRENLREATCTENKRNIKIRKDNKTGFKGVTCAGTFEKYIVRITVNKRVIPLGRFDDPREAARKYDSAARYYFGEFARLNFPVGIEQQA